MKDVELWFEGLFGFTEAQVLRGYTKKAYLETQSNFSIKNNTLTSVINGRKFSIGNFTTPTLASLRDKARKSRKGRIRVSHEVVGDVLELHSRPENRGALFQVASQFNCLEFPGPKVIPEMGITHYAMDSTQGPACSLAAAAATVYRNYLVPVNGAVGQTKYNQINNLDLLSKMIGQPGEFFDVVNGYTLSNTMKLKRLKKLVDSSDRDELLGSIKIGLQTNVGVTFAKRFIEPKTSIKVSQCFCSAVSAAYSKVSTEMWEPLATLALDSAYEATILAAASPEVGSNKVWLTFLGGGAFGNRREWIAAAIGRAIAIASDLPLDIRIAHYKKRDNKIIAMIESARDSKAKESTVTLIHRCQTLWDKYHKNPTEKNLKAVFDHIELMKYSKSKKVEGERATCLRAANKEAKLLGW